MIGSIPAVTHESLKEQCLDLSSARS